MPQPNLIIIHTDQQSSWSISAYGDGPVHTPNIDRLGAEGARFDNFFTNSAVCTPSRGCFITGRYPHSHGAYTNNIPLNPDEITFARQLTAAGYDTGYAGKWHLDGHRRPGWVHPQRCFGFTDNHYMFNRGHWKKIIEQRGIEDPTVSPYTVIGDEKSFTTDWLKDKTIDFIRRDRDKPFCYMLSLPDPHGPYTVRTPYDTMFDPAEMEIPQTFGDTDGPSWAAEHQQKIVSAPDAEEQLRKRKAGYCGEVKLIDDCVGQILDELETQGILDDTIVVFTTDHGDYMGEHSLYGKNLMYETAYRIPMLIRYPKTIQPGTIVSEFTTTVDFQPTILTMMDVEPCNREQGRDASPLLRGAGENWDNIAFTHHPSHKIAGIVTPEFNLSLCEAGDATLFDRKADPQELNNLAEDPDYGEIRQKLHTRLAAHHNEVDSPAISWLNL